MLSSTGQPRPPTNREKQTKKNEKLKKKTKNEKFHAIDLPEGTYLSDTYVVYTISFYLYLIFYSTFPFSASNSFLCSGLPFPSPMAARRQGQVYLHPCLPLLQCLRCPPPVHLTIGKGNRLWHWTIKVHMEEVYKYFAKVFYSPKNNVNVLHPIFT